MRRPPLEIRHLAQSMSLTAVRVLLVRDCRTTVRSVKSLFPNGPWCSGPYGESAAPEALPLLCSAADALEDQWPGGRGSVADLDCSGQSGRGSASSLFLP